MTLMTRPCALAAILLSLFATFARADEPVDDPRVAIGRAVAAAERKDWAEAEVAYREAASITAIRMEKEPGNLDLVDARNTLEYDVACTAALQDHVDAAAAMISGLLDRGWFDNDDLLGTDTDLAALRKDAARFDALRERERRILADACEGHDEGRVLVPAKTDVVKAKSGIVVLHGGGGNIEGGAAAWQRVADRTGAVVVLVRGSVVQGKGEFSYNQRRPERDVARIETWIAKARERAPNLPDDELFLAGFSQGGMAWVLGTEGPRAWRGIIPIGGYVQVALRERVKREPTHPLAAFALVGAEDEKAIREVNAQLIARTSLPRFRGILVTLPGGHGLPSDLPARMTRALRWCRKAFPRG
jgi:predicted esterase